MSSELARLKGLGIKRVQALEESSIVGLRDLIYYLPRRYIDRTQLGHISDLKAGDEAWILAEVESFRLLGSSGRSGRSRLEVIVTEMNHSLNLIFFQGAEFWQKRFKQGQKLAVAGKVQEFQDTLQIAHPELQWLTSDELPKTEILPRYRLSEAMHASRIDHKRIQALALEVLTNFTFSDPLELELQRHFNLIPEKALLEYLHAPDSMQNIPQWIRQLKIRELVPLCLQLEAAFANRAKLASPWPMGESLATRIKQALPFSLTAGQLQSTERIRKALSSEMQFFGLLQGDVGAGKTIVSLLAASGVLEGMGQVAIMAPTEILASQHAEVLGSLLSQVGIEYALLTGSTEKSARINLVQQLVEGKIQVLFGTHVLLSSDVQFKNLGLVVVDEQHRFGVEQRKSILAKGHYPHALYMTATPIPQSLAQSIYGDLESIILKEKPPGRQVVKTRIVPPQKRNDMLGFLLQEVKKGAQIFWVSPQIGAKESKNNVVNNIWWDEIDSDAATPKESALVSLADIHKELKQFSSEWKSEILHGKMHGTEKEKILTRFRKKEFDILVATTVIEVGVDVASANYIVIENPERLGLAQLHQLRGRTGRGGAEAWCFLAQPKGDWSESSFERLREFCHIEDGFKLADLDLSQRGPGDLLGNDQSGFGSLKFVDLVQDAELIKEVRQSCKSLM